MKMSIVLMGDSDANAPFDPRVIKVFSTREKAEAYVQTHPSGRYNEYVIEDHEVL